MNYLLGISYGVHAPSFDKLRMTNIGGSFLRQAQDDNIDKLRITTFGETSFERLR
jgi:hypothetical protein